MALGPVIASKGATSALNASGIKNDIYVRKWTTTKGKGKKKREIEHEVHVNPISLAVGAAAAATAALGLGVAAWVAGVKLRPTEGKEKTRYVRIYTPVYETVTVVDSPAVPAHTEVRVVTPAIPGHYQGEVNYTGALSPTAGAGSTDTTGYLHGGSVQGTSQIWIPPIPAVTETYIITPAVPGHWQQAVNYTGELSPTAGAGTTDTSGYLHGGPQTWIPEVPAVTGTRILSAEVPGYWMQTNTGGTGGTWVPAVPAVTETIVVPAIPEVSHPDTRLKKAGRIIVLTDRNIPLRTVPFTSVDMASCMTSKHELATGWHAVSVVQVSSGNKDVTGEYDLWKGVIRNDGKHTLSLDQRPPASLGSLVRVG